jgi:hypothetical protein
VLGTLQAFPLQKLAEITSSNQYHSLRICRTVVLKCSTIGPTTTQPPRRCGPTTIRPPRRCGPTTIRPPRRCGPTTIRPPRRCGPTTIRPPRRCGPTTIRPPRRCGPTTTRPPRRCGPTTTRPPRRCGPTGLIASNQRAMIDMLADRNCSVFAFSTSATVNSSGKSGPGTRTSGSSFPDCLASNP